MKYLLFGLIAFVSISSQASVKCIDLAEKKAAKYLKISLAEFREDYSVLLSCKDKSNPNLETFEFGDGSAFVGVELVITKGKCVTKSIYSGQDDQDSEGSDVESNCLPN